MRSTTTVQRKTTGRVRRQSYRNHPECWRQSPVKGNTKCKDVSWKHDDECQLRTGHKSRHFGVNGSRWNHERVGAH